MILVDSDILIDASHQEPKAMNFIITNTGTVALAISSITYMEIMVGARNKRELQIVEQFLSNFHSIKLDTLITDEALKLIRQYHLSHRLAIPDALIAATALVYQLDFISKNQRDYKFIKGLKLLPY